MPPEQFTPLARFDGSIVVERTAATTSRQSFSPYIEKLHFQPGSDTADPDQRFLSDEDLERAMAEGQQLG